MTDYDSRVDTFEHIREVQERLAICVVSLLKRSINHDQSKLEEPELSMFNEYTPKLRAMSYDTDPKSEYQKTLKEMGEALKHHYAKNTHHPEHYGAAGIKAMSLLDVLEMLCDWSAAVMRHDDGDIFRSIEQNQKRFGYSDDLKEILVNTVEELGI